MANVLDHSAAHSQREQHAADHQGHEDGLGGEAAPRAGTRFGGASVRADADQRAEVAGVDARRFMTRRRASRSIRCSSARPRKTVLLIVVTGDKGLAGAFNANILKAAHRFIEDKEGQEHRRRVRSAARVATTSAAAIQWCKRRRSARRDRSRLLAEQVDIWARWISRKRTARLPNG